MSDDLNSQLVAASKAIVESDSRRKLIVAGPGTGKTFTFKGLLEKNGTAAGNALVLTFINNLKDDLERDLSGLAEVFTFHGHCLRLLYRYPSIRRGLTAKFEFFPSLPSLIKSDWNVIENGTAPKFVGMMRQLNSNADTEFYMQRSNFYDAVSYDDSLYRVYNRLQQRSENLPQYQLVLVDEYQDFNLLEASLIHLLSERSPLVIAGDDDQALYVQLRGSAPKFIRDLYNSGEFELFELPFSMRCTQPVVNAIRDVLSTATSKGKLAGRIPKRYEYSPPQKADDSARYPRIMTVHTSVQSKRDNYFGKYIEREIAKIPPEEIVESNGGYFPTVLIIGAKHYTSQVRDYLEGQGFDCGIVPPREPDELDRSYALQLLQQNPESNLAWRILLGIDKPSCAIKVIEESLREGTDLHKELESQYRIGVLAEVAELSTETEDTVGTTGTPDQPADALKLTIRITSFEGSKGLSAQHVFVVGLHNGDLPRDPTDISDLEICKFLVALTRTRKQCYLLHTGRWSGKIKQRSEFISWITGWTQDTYVDKNYWLED